MTPDISERAFEEAIEWALLRYGPDAYPDDATTVRESAPEFGDEPLSGGYLRRRPEDYDRALCLIPTDVVDFLLATQPKVWEKLKQHHGADVKPRFLGRLSREIARRGARDVGQDQLGEPLPRRQLHEKLAVRPLAGTDEGGAGIGAVHAHRVRQPIRQDVVPLHAFFGDDRLGHGTSSRRVAARSGLDERIEEIAPRHALLRCASAAPPSSLPGSGQTQGSKSV